MRGDDSKRTDRVSELLTRPSPAGEPIPIPEEPELLRPSLDSARKVLAGNSPWHPESIPGPDGITVEVLHPPGFHGYFEQPEEDDDEENGLLTSKDGVKVELTQQTEGNLEHEEMSVDAVSNLDATTTPPGVRVEKIQQSRNGEVIKDFDRALTGLVPPDMESTVRELLRQTCDGREILRSRKNGHGQDGMPHFDVSGQRSTSRSLELDEKARIISGPQGQDLSIPDDLSLEDAKLDSPVLLGGIPSLAGLDLQALMNEHSLPTLSSDGKQKANFIHRLEFLDDQFDGDLKQDDNLVLVLIESRLLDPDHSTLAPLDSGIISELANKHGTKASGLSKQLFDCLTVFRDDLNNTHCDFAERDQFTTNAPYDYRASLIVTDVYGHRPGETSHIDGKTVLSLRDFFISVKKKFRNFRGVIFVGAFPEAMLVRTIGGISPSGNLWGSTHVAAYRTDLPMADLDGNWDQLWKAGPHALQISLLPSKFDKFPKSVLEIPMGSLTSSPTFISDYFYLSDYDVPIDVKTNVPSWRGLRDAEVGDSDSKGDLLDKNGNLITTPTSGPPLTRTGLLYSEKTYDEGEEWVYKWTHDGKFYYGPGTDNAYKVQDEHGRWKLWNSHGRRVRDEGLTEIRNPISRPDILISRINAQNVAFTRGKMLCWNRDPFLERQLLVNYFQRNHAYRTNPPATPFCTALAAPLIGDPVQDSHLRSTEGAFRDFWMDCPKIKKLFKTVTSNGVTRTIPDYQDHDWNKVHASRYSGYHAQKVPISFLEWLKKSAVLRSLRMHGYAQGLYYPDKTNKVDFSLMRSLWDEPSYQGMDSGGANSSFFWINSCHANSPQFAETMPFNQPCYGFGQPAECLLFYCKGLAVLARSHSDWVNPGYPGPKDWEKQVYNSNFELTLEAGRTFGETWRAIFENEMYDPMYNPKEHTHASSNLNANRKNAYRHGVVGDWTLRLNP